ESRPSGGDAPHGLDERVDVHDPVLEQVPDAAVAAPLEKLRGVALLDVLRDHEDRDLGKTASHLERSAKALVAERRRQPDVDDRDVRLLGDHLVHEPVAVGDGGDDVEAVVAQKPREAVAKEREVLRDHDPHGSSALTTVGPPGGLTTANVPSSASTRCRRPRSPFPSPSAPPRPSSSTRTWSTSPRRAIVTRTPVAPACLPAFASASDTT